MKQEQNVRITVQIHNNKEVDLIVVDFVPGTTVEELILFLKEEEYLPLNICHLKCYCQQLNRYYHHKELIDISLPNQTIIISDNDSQKELIKQDYQFSTIKEISWICDLHPNNPIIYICLDKHSCQRKMCQNCILDQNHIESKHNFLPINHFFSVIRAKAKQLLNHKKNFDIIDQYLDDIERDVKAFIQNYKIEIEKAKILLYDSMQLATDLMDIIDSQNMYDRSIMKEIVHIYKSNQIYMQEIINGINLKTIQDNIQRFNLCFNKFQQEVENLKFIVLAEHKYQDLKKLSKTKATLNEFDQIYGKYLVSQSGLKIEILKNGSLQEIYHLDWNPDLTLRDIDNYVRHQLKTSENESKIIKLIEGDQLIENMVYFSTLLNEELHEPDEKLYHLIQNDLIKVTVTNQSPNSQRINNSLILLNIQIEEGEQIRLVPMQFDQEYMIYEIQEVILDFCGKSNNEKYLDLTINNLLVNYETDSHLTLQQLQITPNSVIGVKIRECQIKKVLNQKSTTQLNIYPESPTVQLELRIKDGISISSLSSNFYINQGLDQVYRYIQDCLGLSTVHLFVEGMPLFNVPRNMTLRELNIQDNQIIKGRIAQ